jgi:MerR family transcriptional regulator, light-induced transcriptional regulator
MTTHFFRIGEAARRAGVSPEVLRAWERRYGLVRPTRTEGGFRLYSEDDVDRIARMRGLVARGVAAAEAARSVTESAAAAEEARPAAAAVDAQGALLAAVESYDDGAAHLLLDRLLADLTVETVLRETVFPVLHEIGARWASGELSVGNEHFASHLLRGRLLGLARGWGRGSGPLALLACPSGEQHDLALIGHGIGLARLGWRVAYLGADTPLDTIAAAAASVEPAAVVLAMTWDGPAADTTGLRKLARSHRVALGGAAVDEDIAREVGGVLLAGDPVSAAETLAGS